jgi:hypothetical protein
MINMFTWNKIDNFDLLVCANLENVCLIFIDLAPTHAILAFKRALDELDEEGGIQGRAKRLNESIRLNFRFYIFS